MEWKWAKNPPLSFTLVNLREFISNYNHSGPQFEEMTSVIPTVDQTLSNNCLKLKEPKINNDHNVKE